MIRKVGKRDGLILLPCCKKSVNPFAGLPSAILCKCAWLRRNYGAALPNSAVTKWNFSTLSVSMVVVMAFQNDRNLFWTENFIMTGRRACVVMKCVCDLTTRLSATLLIRSLANWSWTLIIHEHWFRLIISTVHTSMRADRTVGSMRVAEILSFSGNFMRWKNGKMDTIFQKQNQMKLGMSKFWYHKVLWHFLGSTLQI